MMKTMNPNSSVILIKTVCWKRRIRRGWRLSQRGRTITTSAVAIV